MDKEKWFSCVCSLVDHNFRVSYFDDGEDMLYFEIAMIKPSFFNRVKIAFKYLFGMGRSSHYDNVILNEQKSDELIEFLQNFKKSRHKYNMAKEIG